MGWWKDLWKSRTKDWIHEPLSGSQVPGDGEHRTISSEEGYLDVWLRSMRVVNVRKGLSKFYGTVHSHISLLHLDKGVAEFQVVTTPDSLKDKDAKHLDRVISFNHRLLGPIPYRGGDVELELGLFSVKSADLAAPYIQLLEKMSGIAGVSFISSALPFVGPLKDGINLLTGGSDATILEIGLSRAFSPAQTGYFFIMRAEKDKVDVASLSLGNSYQLVGPDGDPVRDYPYLVYSFGISKQRDDWFTIPGIATSYAALRKAIQTGKIKEAEEAFAVFKRTTLTSGDLLVEDAKRLIQKVEDEVQSGLGAALTTASIASIPALQSIKLYE